MQEQAEHMFSHSAVAHTATSVEQLVFTHPAVPQRLSGLFSRADNCFFDAGEDGDDETTHAETHDKMRRNVRTTEHVQETIKSDGLQCPSFRPQRCEALIPHAQSIPRKRPLDSLSFLSAYSSTEPAVFDQRSSKTVDSSTARLQKRQKLADSTSRDLEAEKTSVRKTGNRKRREIFDQTYRADFGGFSDR
jgi:hypothetical protein